MDVDQIWCVSAKASQEDGNHTARPIHVHLLRQSDGKTALGGNLELSVVQEDGCWRCLDCVVSATRRYNGMERVNHVVKEQSSDVLELGRLRQQLQGLRYVGYERLRRCRRLMKVVQLGFRLGSSIRSLMDDRTDSR